MVDPCDQEKADCALRATLRQPISPLAVEASSVVPWPPEVSASRRRRDTWEKFFCINAGGTFLEDAKLYIQSF